MFDIGIMELALIAVVALLVIGPERLPAVARTVGFWLGKVRRFVSSVQEDFNREVIKSEELKRLVEEQSKIKDMHEIIEKTVDESRKTVSIGADITSGLDANHQEPDQKHDRATPQLDSGVAAKHQDVESEKVQEAAQEKKQSEL